MRVAALLCGAALAAAHDDRISAIFARYDQDSDGVLRFAEVRRFHSETMLRDPAAVDEGALDEEDFAGLQEQLGAAGAGGLLREHLGALYDMNGRLEADYAALFPEGHTQEAPAEPTPKKKKKKKREKTQKQAEKHEQPEQSGEQPSDGEQPPRKVTATQHGTKLEIKVDSPDTLEFLKMIQESARIAALAGPEKEEELDVMLGAAAEASGIDVETLQQMVAVEKRKARIEAGKETLDEQCRS
eukprot:TRINITY_DN4239_c2_g1_i1.p1 TRINITY_DN4239_c2_g1~~TRINITY_DN4239_c2_g1_i1.p1  ORF type:complete len:266 (+),score=119.91 TRINITY_DN4239_c2_g1_i1:70-798(+)